MRPFAPASLLLYEGFGRAPSEFETRARRDGDGWLLSGTKLAVAYPVDAELGLVVARDDGGQLRAFVVEDLADAATLSGLDDRCVALSAVPTADVTLDELRASDASALGTDGLAFALSVCRLAQAAIALGTADATTRYAADWGRARVAFGRPLVGFQGVSFVLANLFMEIENARLGLADIATSDPARSADVEARTSRLVAQANQLVGDAGREGVELMGVHGVIAEHPAERYFRSAAALTAVDFDPLTNPLVLR